MRSFHVRGACRAVGMLLAIGLLAPALSQAQDAPAGKTSLPPGMQSGMSYQNDISLPLYYLPVWQGGGEHEEGHDGNENPKLPNHHIDSVDPVVQHTMAPDVAMPNPILSFDGIGFPGVSCNCAPPDTDGEVGNTQFVQMVNEGFQIFNKATGATVAGPTGISALWAGFGGVCETSGHGDPVVLYDQMAQRWVISQFAGGSIPTDECIAVSQTSDAAGSYYRYGFHLGSNFFDYPHFGVWPDAYYMAMNIFNSSGTALLGPQAFAFDRNAMLQGLPATFVTPGITGGPGEESFLPADMDGLLPPPLGAPGIFVEYPGGGTYKTWHFHVDFATPGNSTFTVAGSPAAAGFTTLCPSSRNCVPQLGGTGSNAIDGIGDRLMFRLAYRNFGDHEATVGNFTVSSGGVAGIRWFELRNATGTPTLFQESTYQPDTTWRWMGSAAMDTLGNLALGFSASSASINPQIRYAGRLANDPVGTLTQADAHLFDGTGSQQGTNGRWGDYSDLTVDPVDDCTFWYTSEYYTTNASFNWKTRIGSFKFPNCSLTPGFTLATTPGSLSVCAGTPATLTVNVGSTSSFNNPVTLSGSGNPSPSTLSFSPNPVTPLPGSSTLTVGNTGSVAAGSYTLTINGTASGASAQSTTVDMSVFTSAPPASTLTTPVNGANNQPLRPSFSWSGNNAEDYTIEIATDAAFTNVVVSDVVTGTTYTPSVDLASNSLYFWRVTANNACGDAASSATFTFTTLPLPGDCSAGTVPTAVYSYGFESGLSGWTLGAGSVGNTWADNTTSAHSGTHSWKAADTGAVSDQRFVSPAIVLPSGQLPVTLQFWAKRDMEAQSDTLCYDGGILEASTDGGTTWTQVGNPALLTDPYTGPINATFQNPLANLQAWCGVEDWTHAIVDVSGLAGQTVQFRYRLGSDSSVGHDGWYLDDVSVQSCAASGATYTVGGNVSGLAGSGLVLSLNGSQSLPVSANGAFTFPGALPDGSAYAVTVGTQPSGQTCTVANGSGLISGGNVTNVAVTCTTATYTVGGTVSGLAGSGLSLSLNGGAQNLPVSANGSFTFPTGLANGATYAVTVGTQPSNPTQTCTVANGSGTISGANVTNVAVTCTTATYTIGGTVSGLSGSGLVLSLNGAQNLPVSANGSFTFPTGLASGASYAVTVGTQPSGQSCSVANGSGTVGNANVTNVTVTCATNTYLVGGTVSGLLGNSVTLALNGSAQTTVVAANGSFAFPTGLASGAPYAVTVSAQPTGPIETCTVTNGSGTVGGGDITSVTVVCSDAIFTYGFEDLD
jgi:hypothetical protein